ncbi:MAG: SH3 domain-containing protein, partial [Chloroflexota bacterium]
MTIKIFLIALTILLMASFTLAQSEDNVDCPTDFEGYLAPRLTIDHQARVEFDIQLNVRPEPTIDEARLDRLTGGAQVVVLEGPVCADAFIWWQIETDNLVGWVAEGSLDDNEYFLEPRRERLIIENEDGEEEIFIRTASGFVEPEGCAIPPDNYEQIQLGFATLNQRTLFMLDNAQRIYNDEGGTWANFRLLLTQGSYNAGGVVASFGTHDGGGAVDIAVIDTQNGWVIRR